MRGTVMVVTPAAGHAGPGLAIPPLVPEIHGRDQAGHPLTATSAPTGYGPAQLQAYLGLHGDGTGQTVAITDAFDDPAIVSDVNTYVLAGISASPLTQG